MARLFNKGFETGDTNDFDWKDGTVTVDAGSKINGNYGASVAVSSSNDVGVNLASLKKHLWVRFYINTNSVSMAQYAGIRTLICQSSSWGYVAKCELRKDIGSDYIMVLSIDNDVSGATETSWTVNLTNGIHYIEIEVKISSAPGANDGFGKLYIDGILNQTITGIDNDTHDIQHVKLGAMDGWGTVSGNIIVDDLAIDDSAYIGVFSAMYLTVNINSVDKTNLVSWESLNIDDVVNDKANTCSFDIKVHAGQAYKPSIRDTVEILDGTTKIFSGKIVSINETAEGKVVTQKITVKDWTLELDRAIVTERYTNQTINQIIADLISSYLPGTGITGNNVSCSILVASVAFNSIPVSKAIQNLAEQVNYSWYIDYNKDIHFFAKNTEPAPFNLDDNSGNFIWDSLEINNDISQLRNVVTVRGGDKTATSNKTKYYTGDGNQKVFGTDYKFASIPTVTVGGISKTVGIDNIDPDANFDCLWNYDQKYIRFVNAPAGSAAIQIIGYPLIPIIVQVEDLASISNYGRYEYKAIDKNISSDGEAQQYAQAQLDAYGQSIREGSFMTYISGLKSGQTIGINIIARSLNDIFIIQRVNLRMMSQTDGEWSIELATMRSMGIIDFLQKLLLGESKTIVLDDNAVLEKFTQLNETIQVTEDITLVVPNQDYQTAQVTEEVLKDPFGAGVYPNFVLGPYTPTSNSDPNREFCMDTCPLA